jgi:hypothetical protein
MSASTNRWTAISGIAALAGLAIPFVLYVSTRTSTGLAVVTISRSTIADLANPALSAARMTFHGEAVSRVVAATFEVANTGSEAIQAHAFERPIEMRFAGERPVLDAVVEQCDPANLTPRVTSDTAQVTVAPLLLNPSDRFRITVFLRGDFVEPQIDLRIAGIKAPQRTMLTDGTTWRRPVSRIVLGALLFCAYFYLLGLIKFRSKVSILPRFDGLLLVFVLGLGAIVLMGDGLRHLAVSDANTLWILGSSVVPTSMLLWVAMSRRRTIDRELADAGLPLE